MADQTELRMNLAAVKRADPYAKEIVETSAHVAFYTFNYEDNEWEKTDVEGAFFVYRRTAEPYHSIFINNRLNTNSLVEPLTADLELQAQPPFLLYRNERSRIRGFWFYNKDELQRVAGLVNALVKECQKRQNVHPGAGGPPPVANMMANSNSFRANGTHDGGMNGGAGEPPKNPVNILHMLHAAQDEFYKMSNPPNVMPGPPPLQVVQMDGGMLGALLPKMNLNQNNHNNGGHAPPPQQQPPAPPVMGNGKDAVTSQSVMNFFASAKPTIPPPNAQQQQHHAVPPPQVLHSNGIGGGGGGGVGSGLKVASPAPPMLQRLMSNPVHTLEHIEMQHRAVTPQEVRPATCDDQGPHVSAENGFNWKAKTGEPKATNGKDDTWAALFQPKISAAGVPIVAEAKQGKAGGKKAQPSTPSAGSASASKPALMTPTMFKKTEPLSKEDPTNPSLIPTGSKRETAKGSADVAMKPEPLNQSQMLQAMTYLMKNDADFMKKLHEAYLKSFSEMMAP